MNTLPIKAYRPWLAALKENIQQQKMRTSLQANAAMLVLYWYIGKQINDKIDKEGWGTKVIERLSIDLQKSFPDLQGFSERSLKYMRKFSQSYPDMLIVQQAVAQLNKQPEKIIEKTTASKRVKNSKIEIVQRPAAQLGMQENTIVQQAVAQFSNIVYTVSNPLLVSIPRGHHVLILDKLNYEYEKIWYIQKTLDNNWGRAVLQYQIERGLYQRQHKSKKVSNFHLTLPKPQSDLANQLLKDPYKFDFLNLGDTFTEQQLENELVNHIQSFLIELGAGFAFVGRQYKLKAGRKEYRVDLLFYHLILRCYIAIELKMEEFEFEHTGQMSGYLNIINRLLKHEHDNPSIGIILCKSKDEVEVDFALSNNAHPIGVTEYMFNKALPRKFQGMIPGARELQNEVKKFLRKRTAAKKQ